MEKASPPEFAIFNIPTGFNLDLQLLQRRYDALVLKAHPDHWVGGPQWLQEASIARTARLNEAYGVLKDPVKRARVVLSWHGVDINQQHCLAADLEEQLAWHERARDPALLAALQEALEQEVLTLGTLMDQQQFVEAASSAQRLKFLYKIVQDGA